MLAVLMKMNMEWVCVRVSAADSRVKVLVDYERW